MLLAVLIALASAIYVGRMVLIAVGLYKDPVLRHFELYAERDDSYCLIPPLFFGIGMMALSAGFMFSSRIAPLFPAVLVSALFFLVALWTRENPRLMAAHPRIFLAFPRWYVQLRERTTREERRHIAYMWLALPRPMRLHLNGSDHHFLLWADYVILATVTQTVEDQESDNEFRQYIPDLHGRYG